MQRTTSIIALWGVLLAAGPLPAAEPRLVPQPRDMTVAEGEYALTPATPLAAPAGCKAAAQFAAWLERGTRWKLPPTTRSNGGLRFEAIDAADVGPEGYRMTIGPEGIAIAAATEAGWFYGAQTLRQLLPPELESQATAPRAESLPLPALRITDRPEFGWRGLMLDESRRFFGKAKVLQLLDWMALHKLNRFHWHLTDDPGWRLEIKKYPKLTEIGGCGDSHDPHGPRRFYSQEDVREIVAFAAARQIVVVPEIDMPGHAAAASRAYPEHSGGGSEKHPGFTFNPARPATLAFLDDILAETAGLFPGPWIHFGGDEVFFGNQQWPELPEVKELMAREGLPNKLAVERWFNRRMAGAIAKLGRTTIGWDEIAAAKVDPHSSVIMWWRHDRPNVLKQALEGDYAVVLCPRIPCYFDYVQDGSHKYGRRAKGGAVCNLPTLHAFPDFAALSIPEARRRQVLGIQACVWTDKIGNEKLLDFMINPRLAALAESAWTSPSRKDYGDFLRRLPAVQRRMAVLGIDSFNPFDKDKTPEPLPAKDNVQTNLSMTSS
jgi:hexosaminidase